MHFQKLKKVLACIFKNNKITSNTTKNINRCTKNDAHIIYSFVKMESDTTQEYFNIVTLNKLYLSTQANSSYQWVFVSTEDYINGNNMYVHKFLFIKDEHGKYMIQCNTGAVNSYLCIDTTSKYDYQYAFFATQQYLDNHLQYTNKFTLIQEADEIYIVFNNLYLAYNFNSTYKWDWVIFANENYFKKHKDYATQFTKIQI